MNDTVERLRELGKVLEEQWLIDAAHEMERLRRMLDDVVAEVELPQSIEKRVREALGQ